ncbi:MAG: hypothetical protein EAZ43_11745 [Betaproteobacteria bacterium]|nr:MAG: hypothetical protein EAZ43_11745 [Betaproteobacteria bacterium]
MMLTTRQKSPISFTVTVDEATALSLAVHSKVDPAQYAAGLLMQTCRTAAALKLSPGDLMPMAILQAIKP